MAPVRIATLAVGHIFHQRRMVASSVVASLRPCLGASADACRYPYRLYASYRSSRLPRRMAGEDMPATRRIGEGRLKQGVRLGCGHSSPSLSCRCCAIRAILMHRCLAFLLAGFMLRQLNTMPQGLHPGALLFLVFSASIRSLASAIEAGRGRWASRACKRLSCAGLAGRCRMASALAFTRRAIRSEGASRLTQRRNPATVGTSCFTTMRASTGAERRGIDGATAWAGFRCETRRCGGVGGVGGPSGRSGGRRGLRVGRFFVYHGSAFQKSMWSAWHQLHPGLGVPPEPGFLCPVPKKKRPCGAVCAPAGPLRREWRCSPVARWQICLILRCPPRACNGKRGLASAEIACIIPVSSVHHLHTGNCPSVGAGKLQR